MKTVLRVAQFETKKDGEATHGVAQFEKVEKMGKRPTGWLSLRVAQFETKKT